MWKRAGKHNKNLMCHNITQTGQTDTAYNSKYDLPVHLQKEKEDLEMIVMQIILPQHVIKLLQKKFGTYIHCSKTYLLPCKIKLVPLIKDNHKTRDRFNYCM